MNDIGKPIRLANGLDMPRVGLGLYLMEPKEALAAVSAAYAAGYRLFDTATIYRNEHALSEALHSLKCASEKDVFVTTKLQSKDHGYEAAKKAISTSLSELRRDHIDLYLVHWPAGSRIPLASPKHAELRRATWSALEEAYEEGKVRAIGVSNYTVKHLREMEGYARVMPHVNQIELHPAYYRAQALVIEYCKKKNIVVQAYASLAEGKLLHGSYRDAEDIAERHGKKAAHVLLRWALQHGWAIIPKSSNAERIKENFDIYDFVLTDAEMHTLDNRAEPEFKVCWSPEEVA